MPTTYSSKLRLSIIQTGEQAGQWGDITNTNLGDLLEQAIAGYRTVSITDTDYTLTTVNGALDDARSMAIKVTSSVTLTATRNVICPSGVSFSKLYVIRNATTGGQSIVIKTAAGTGVTVPNGKSTIVVCDGTNVTEAISDSTSLVPAGAIMLWSGSVATIPAGWYLCDGANGTPNLRDRFVVGAGSTYAVGATGGSANATLPSHNHTVSGGTSNENNNHQHFFSGTTGDNNQSHTHSIPDLQLGYGEGGAIGVAYGSWQGVFPSATSTESNPHNHSYTGTTESQNAGHGHTFTATSSTEGASSTNANLPPYYALAYIMKA